MFSFRHCLLFSTLLGLTACASILLPTVRDELLEMEHNDQSVREVLIARGVSDTAAMKQMQQVDSVNTARLKQIVAQHGVLTREQVGRDGLAAVFIVVQHSPDHEFQKGYLPHLQRLAQQGDASKQEVALLTDRVRVHDGEPQLYGTQLTMEAGKFVPFPIENPDSVDVRRAGMGLPPLQWYIEMVEQRMKQQGE